MNKLTVLPFLLQWATIVKPVSSRASVIYAPLVRVGPKASLFCHQQNLNEEKYLEDQIVSFALVPKILLSLNLLHA